jgi:hypothetical protein
MAVNNVSEHIRIAQTLTQNTVPVLILKPGLKRPLAKPGTDRWWVLDDPDNVEAAFQSLGNHVVPNIGMLVGWQKQSPVIGVGADLYKDKKAGDKLKELGVSSNAAVWIQRTGRGGLTLIYYSPDVELKRDIEPEGEAIDLLLNGYTVISPSNTSNEPGGGGPYTWVKGHSPYDIPLAELDTPPKDLLLWWQSLSAKPLPQVQAGNGNAHDGLITGPVCD